MKHYYKISPDMIKEIMVLYNKIYAKDGFLGVIQTLRESLTNGTVENINGLYKITVDDSFGNNIVIDALLYPKSLMLQHYKGFVCENIYYFSEDICDEVEMINVTKLEDEEFEERTRKALKQVEDNPNRKILTAEEFLNYISIN